MFAKLSQPPRLWVAVEILAIDRFRISVLSAKGRESAEYDLVETDTDGTTHGALIRSATNEYACAITDDGYGQCDCEDFDRRSGRDGKLCKHLFALAAIGALPWPEEVKRPIYLSEPVNVRTNEDRARQQPAEDRAAARAS
jgi:hypothetical protein